MKSIHQKAITIEYLLSKTIQTKDGCLEWTGTKSANGGYGIFQRDNKDCRVTREIMSLLGYEIGGLHVCHRCDNPPCINPDHLFVGTPLDNVRDAMAKGRRVRGSTEHGTVNLYINHKCRCLKCRHAWADYFRDKKRAYYARKKPKFND